MADGGVEWWGCGRPIVRTEGEGGSEKGTSKRNIIVLRGDRTPGMMVGKRQAYKLHHRHKTMKNQSHTGRKPNKKAVGNSDEGV